MLLVLRYCIPSATGSSIANRFSVSGLHSVPKCKTHSTVPLRLPPFYRNIAHAPTFKQQTSALSGPLPHSSKPRWGYDLETLTTFNLLEKVPESAWQNHILHAVDPNQLFIKQIETNQLTDKYGSACPHWFIATRPPSRDGVLIGRCILFSIITALSVHILPAIGFGNFARDPITLLLRTIAFSLILQCGLHLGMVNAQYASPIPMKPFLLRQVRIQGLSAAAFTIPSFLTLTLADTWVRDTCYTEFSLLLLFTGFDYILHRINLVPPWYLPAMILVRLSLTACLALVVISEKFNVNDRPIQFNMEA